MRLGTYSSLASRNEELVRELERIRRVNQDLKRLLRKMLTKDLRLDKSFVDEETQTDFIDSISIIKPQTSKYVHIDTPTIGFMHTLSPHLEDQDIAVKKTRRSTMLAKPNCVKIQFDEKLFDIKTFENKIKYRKTPAKQRRELIAAVTEAVDESPDIKRESTGQQAVDVDGSSPIALLSNYYEDCIRSGLAGQQVHQSPIISMTTAHFVSKSQDAEWSTTPKTSSKTPRGDLDGTLATIVFAARTSPNSSPMQLLVTPPSNRPARNMVQVGDTPLQRSRRSIPRPVSYMETPLNVKVRKDHKFFKFA